MRPGPNRGPVTPVESTLSFLPRITNASEVVDTGVEELLRLATLNIETSYPCGRPEAVDPGKQGFGCAAPAPASRRCPACVMVMVFRRKLGRGIGHSC